LLAAAVGLVVAATIVGTVGDSLLHLPGPLTITVAAVFFAIGVLFRRSG
jgi:hypothetical protein